MYGDQHLQVLSGDLVAAAFDLKMYSKSRQSAAMASTEPVAKRTK
jgi:hypothetical protein